MNHLSDVNCVSEGRNWEDGERDWIDANFYGVAGGEGYWEILKGGKVLHRVPCVDVPWWRCVEWAPAGLILEFGVRGGASLRHIAKAADRTVYGFDWWKGLPHSAGGFTRGDCVADKPTDLPDNVILVDGLFSDTLEGFLEVHRDPVGFVNLDCDLYSSSLYVLHCLMDRFVTGSIIALSDIAFSPDAQRKAWFRYLGESGHAWQFIGKNHPWGEVYRCVDNKNG